MKKVKVYLLFNFFIVGLALFMIQQGSPHAVKATNSGKGKLFDESTLVSKTDSFMQKLVQPIDEDYKVMTFQSKEELIKDFTNVATRSAVEPFIDFYYQEEDGALYIVPTETPPWFDKNAPYSIQRQGDFITVTQTTSNELDGRYTIVLTFVEKNGGWLIDRIAYE